MNDHSFWFLVYYAPAMDDTPTHTMTPSAPIPALSSHAAARAETQRLRILDAAQRCFIAHGFHAASVSGIAAEAGISQGLMYRYFESSAR